MLNTYAKQQLSLTEKFIGASVVQSYEIPIELKVIKYYKICNKCKSL